MLVDGNLPLTLGLAGQVAVIGIIAWFVARTTRRQPIPHSWLIGLGALFLVSIVTTASQIVYIPNFLANAG